jgi:hypothetical protein
VRHVRMLGLCLAALLAVGAFTGGSALAAKDPFNVNTWKQYKHCPFNNETFTTGAHPNCFLGRTAGGAQGGFFTLGNVTVKLNKPIVLQGGFNTRSGEEKAVILAEEQECIANPGYSPECKVAEESSEGVRHYFEYKYAALKVVPAEGAETLEAPELKVAKGLGLINKGIQERQEWPAALSASLKEAKKNKEAGLNVKIEVAGTSLYEHFGGLSTTRLLAEEGPAFVLPLKVHMISPWLEKLGGGPCTIGNDEYPVVQNLSTAPPGRAQEPGGFSSNEEFTNIETGGSRLTDVSWPVPAGADAKGCGGAYEPYVDAAINEVLELNKPNQRGSTFLQGDLHNGNMGAAKEGLEQEGEI